MRKLVSLASAAFLAISLLVLPVAAEVLSSPYLVLESTGNKLFSRIARNHKEIEKFPDVLRVIVKEELMPSIDYKYAAYRILGKQLSKTTKDQRDQFVESVRHYLIRTYANALTQYNNQKVIFEQDKPTNGRSIVTVKTVIVDDSRPDIKLMFKMRKNKKTKQWKAFDLVVEGISLLDSKQAELSRRIAKHGVEQVALELASIAK